MTNESLVIDDISLTKKSGIKSLLWLLFGLFIIEALSTMYWGLSLMSTTGKEFPLQAALGTLQPLYKIVDTFFSIIFFGPLFDWFFREYAWGAFTYAGMTFLLIQWVNNDFTFAELPENLKSGWWLNVAFTIITVISIIYGVDRDLWVPYVQEPTWEINLVHKQQLSAGTFTIFYLFILGLSRLPDSRGFIGSRRFISSKPLSTYVFICFSVDNAASFSWFPGVGYEEIFLYGQGWWSIDKLFHFLMSSALIIILLTFAGKEKLVRMVGLAVSLAILWELFEIGLNPKESSDSLLDMVFNSTSFVLSGLVYQKIDPTNIDNNEDENTNSEID